MNLERQIAYWRDGSLEDFEVARELVARGRLRHGLFWMHLALEKMLKAHVVKTTLAPPPKLHALPRLVEMAALGASPEQLTLLRELNMYQLEGRYPEEELPFVDAETARQDIQHAEVLLEWLIKQF